MEVVSTEVSRTERLVLQPPQRGDDLFHLLKNHLNLKGGVISLKIEMSVRQPTVVEVKYYHSEDGGPRSPTGIPPLSEQ